jgi:hypothetical protein
MIRPKVILDDKFRHERPKPKERIFPKICDEHKNRHYSQFCPDCVQQLILKELIIIRKKFETVLYDGKNRNVPGTDPTKDPTGIPDIILPE